MRWKKKIQKSLNDYSLKSWIKIQTSEKAQITLGSLFLMYFLAGPVFAQTGTATDSFGQLLNLLTNWITGNLGKFIALLGSVISVVVFLFIHRWQILAYGIGGSLLLGGIVGITKFFFEKGSSTFGNSW